MAWTPLGIVLKRLGRWVEIGTGPSSLKRGQNRGLLKELPRGKVGWSSISAPLRHGDQKKLDRLTGFAQKAISESYFNTGLNALEPSRRCCSR